jgi:glycosyltransferase involved in cell wall biosynthesis
MRILHVISSTDPATGGPIEGIRQLLKPLHELGHTVEVACCDAPQSHWLAELGLNGVYALGPARLGYAYAPRLLAWLRENATRYDAIIVHGLWQYHGLAVRQALAGTQVPYFVFTHGMLGEWFKHTYPIKHLKKWLYWPWAEYRVLRDAQAVIFTCEEERLQAWRSFWLYSALEVVSGFGIAPPSENGAELARQFTAKQPHLEGKRVVLFLGRLHRVKGCDLLLKAFAQVAQLDARLHLIMAGPDQVGWAATLRAQAQQLGLTDRISWPGMLREVDKWGAFYAAEVFCLPSHHENFGIVVAEALACGKPVLISNKVNIWHEIELDAAGFVDTDTVAGTVSNLQRWLALDAGGYAAMSKRARQCFATRFHILGTAERLVEIIEA